MFFILTICLVLSTSINCLYCSYCLLNQKNLCIQCVLCILCVFISAVCAKLSAGEGNQILPSLHGGQSGRAAIDGGGTATRGQRNHAAPTLRLVADGEPSQAHDFASQGSHHVDNLVYAGDVACAHTCHHLAIALELGHDSVGGAHGGVAVSRHLCSRFLFHTAKVD